MWTIESTDTIVKLKLNSLGLKELMEINIITNIFCDYSIANSSINTVEESRLLNLPLN